MGYPCANTDNSNARYISNTITCASSSRRPMPIVTSQPSNGPESQKYMPGEDVDQENDDDSILALNEPINDEKGLEYFDTGAVWVPLCNLE